MGLDVHALVCDVNIILYVLGPLKEIANSCFCQGDHRLNVWSFKTVYLDFYSQSYEAGTFNFWGDGLGIIRSCHTWLTASDGFQLMFLLYAIRENI